MLGDISQHDRTSPDSAVSSHGDVAKNFRSSADHHVVFDSGVPLAVLLAGTAESDTLIQSHVVTDDRGFADDHAQPMVNEQPAANCCAGVYFNSGQEARHQIGRA